MQRRGRRVKIIVFEILTPKKSGFFCCSLECRVNTPPKMCVQIYLKEKDIHVYRPLTKRYTKLHSNY
jgi:hypothetical protein